MEHIANQGSWNINSEAINLWLAESKANMISGFWISQILCLILTQLWECRDDKPIVKSSTFPFEWDWKLTKLILSFFMFLGSGSCCISELKPVATGEMQSNPERGWELCSIYNARCTRLSSWINLTGMNAPHWDYNMGVNGRVMSALPSHRGRIHQQLQQGEN